MSGPLRSRFSVLIAAALAVVTIVVGGTTLAGAQAGVGIDPGEIGGLPPLEIGQPVTVTVAVRNPGTAPASFTMLAQPLDGVPEQAPDPAWFAFDPAQFDLAGGESKEVVVTVTPGDGAAAGDYLALLTAQLVLPESGGSGARVGAAVATKLRFSVAPAPESSSFPVGIVIGGVAALAVVVGAVVLIKRSGLKLSVTRER